MVLPFARTFTEIIPFTYVQGEGWYPVVEVDLIKPQGGRQQLKLLFDTGATQIILRSDHEQFFTKVEDQIYDTGAGKTPGRIAKNQQIEFLGVTISCDIGFLPLGPRIWAGLLGRDCFEPFGFGFWEDKHEIYVTLKP
jgi:hypothetical protein